MAGSEETVEEMSDEELVARLCEVLSESLGQIAERHEVRFLLVLEKTLEGQGFATGMTSNMGMSTAGKTLRSLADELDKKIQ